jgi:hypothetical protein
MIKKPDWRYILIATFLVVLTFLCKIYSTEVLSGIKSFFETDYITFYFGAGATIITLLHKIKTKKITFNAKMSFSEFRIPVADLLSFVDSPVTIICALALAKGLFMQSSESVQYFPFFNNLEITFIGLVTIYLFFISSLELWNNFVETFLRKSITDGKIEKSDAKDVKDKLVPEPED